MGEEAIQYERGLTFEKVWAALMETRANDERRAQEFERKMQESAQEFDRRAREFERGMQELKLSMQDTDKQMKETDKKIGRLGNRLGELIEKLLVPNTLAKFKAMGYTFDKISSNVTIEDKHDKTLAEIDFMLENGECALIGEVKLRPNEYDVQDHIERMKKIRTYSDKRGDTRKFIGAIAGAIFRDNVKQCAQAAGFYVVTASGENVNIEPSSKGWKPKTEWA
ncbi:hypothetical protein FACS1894187_24390 [Synergistales bacterium]|nr:hypothetical protein FACS1894187_24390 [Synergistales bacterium]